jgi:hypothetical protein
MRHFHLKRFFDLRSFTLGSPLALALFAGGISADVAAVETSVSTVASKETEGRNEGGLFVGGTVENGEYNFTLGAEYERRLTERFGIIAIAEHVDYYDAWIFLAPVTFRPWPERGLKFYLGPGFETREPEREAPEAGTEGEAVLPAAPAEDGRETLFVLRTGVSWTFNTGGLLLTPQLEVDLGREDEYWEPAVVFGISAGFEF